MARRKKKVEEHENHERWLISYADFITLLFAFFVVMYAISSVNEGKYKVLSNSIVQAFNTSNSSRQIVYLPTPVPEGYVQPGKPLAPILAQQKLSLNPPVDIERKKRREAMKTVATDLLKVMEPLAKAGQVKVTESNRGITIEINASLLFETAKAQLNPDSVKVLTAVAKVIASDSHQIQVEGYTDNQPINSPEYPSNWELSSARASSVIRVFESAGVASNRMVVIGYADNRAVDGNETLEGRARNRRVSVTILAETQGAIQEVALDPDTSPRSAPVPVKN